VEDDEEDTEAVKPLLNDEENEVDACSTGQPDDTTSHFDEQAKLESCEVHDSHIDGAEANNSAVEESSTTNASGTEMSHKDAIRQAEVLARADVMVRGLA